MTAQQTNHAIRGRSSLWASLLQYYLSMIFKMFIISQYIHYWPESSEKQ